MGEINDILKHSRFENLMSCLMDEAENDCEEIENYDEAINESYDKLLSELEDLYPDANKNDDKLFGAVLEFAIIHDNIYFKAGATLGFQLYKEFEMNYEKYKSEDIPALINKSK